LIDIPPRMGDTCAGLAVGPTLLSGMHKFSRSTQALRPLAGIGEEATIGDSVPSVTKRPIVANMRISILDFLETHATADDSGHY
jgi:hypothetical protein